MLCMSRKRGEFVILRDRNTGAEIGKICLVKIVGDKVRIGFDFPDEVVIDRKEIDDMKRGDSPRPSDDPFLPKDTA